MRICDEDNDMGWTCGACDGCYEASVQASKELQQVRAGELRPVGANEWARLPLAGWAWNGDGKATQA